MSEESTTDAGEDARDEEPARDEEHAGDEASATAVDERDAAAVVDSLDKPVLLFDGVCNLCNGFVRFVVKFDADGTFLFAPLQSDVGQELLERHDMSTEDFDTFVLVENGDHFTRSTAVLKVLRRLDGPLPLLYPLVYLPRGVRDRVYDVVAAHRYQVFGKKDACPVPGPELRERFATRTLE